MKARFSYWIFCFALALSIFSPRPSGAVALRSDQPWSASIEVMGRALLYGVTLERTIDPRSAVGVALSRAEAQAQADEPSTLLLPISYYRYFSEQEDSLFLNGGLTLLSNSPGVGGRRAILGTLRYPEVPLMAHLGFGWELRARNGFLFRAQGLLTRSSAFSFSTGFNLGVGF